MKILHLTLKKQWYQLIESGIKKEEYREIKDYWENRLCDDPQIDKSGWRFNFIVKQYDAVLFKNGYSKTARSMLVKWEGMKIGTGNPEWGAEPGKEYFVIKLGEIINPTDEKN